VSDVNTNGIALGPNLEIATPNRTYYLTAEDSIVARRWADAITGGTTIVDTAFSSFTSDGNSYDTYQGPEASGEPGGGVLLAGWWRKKKDSIDQKDRRLFFEVCVFFLQLCVA